MPPFAFFVLLIITAIVAYATNHYPYAYHIGYFIALGAVVELLFLAYGCRYLLDLYQGDYTRQERLIPLFILGGSMVLKAILGMVFVGGVIGRYYLKDVRFQ